MPREATISETWSTQAAGHCHCFGMTTWYLAQGACPETLCPHPYPLIFSRETHQVFTCMLGTGFWGEFSVQAPQTWVWTPKASTSQVIQPL